MIDDAGYTIESGTVVTIAEDGQTSHPFMTTNTVTVDPGDTVTATGEVGLRALLPGEGANNLTADPTLVTTLAYVADGGVALEGTTSGGADAEEIADYLDRLRITLQTLSLAPILPRDVEILALQIDGVARATAIDGYDPSGPSYGNDRMAAVAALDASGNPVSADTKTAIDEYLEGLREVNFVFNVIDPTSNTIHASVVVVPHAGFDAPTVAQNVEAVLSDYFDAANWGIPETTEPGGGWENETVVRFFEVVSTVDRTAGVDYVDELYIGSASKSLTGVAATDVITSNAHGYSDGDRVVLTALTGGTGLTTGTVYFVRDSTANTYKLAATAGGAAIDFSSDISAGTSVELAQADITLTGPAPIPVAGELIVSAA